MKLLAARDLSTWTDERLVSACLRGDEAAWSALIDRYKKLIYSVARRYHATPEDAADVFQGVCLDLVNELPRLRQAESVRPWLVTVAARRSLRQKEQRKRREQREGVPLEDPSAVPEPVTPPAFLEELEREQMLREAVGQLSPRCRELVQLLFYQDPPLPYADVARRLGLATGSIGFIRGRCLKRLQDLLEKKGF